MPGFARPTLLVLLGAALLALQVVWVDLPVADAVLDPRWQAQIDRPLRIALGLAPFLLIMGMLTVFPNHRRLWGGFAIALLLTATVTHLLKWSVGRARPFVDSNPLLFDTFVRDGAFESFPSGHTSNAVAMAILLGIYFPKARRLFYFCAVLVALERMVADKHWLSDVLVGALVGWGCVRWLIWLSPAHFEPHRRPEGPNVGAAAREMR